MKSWLKKAAGIVFTDGKSILLMKRAGEGEHIGTWGLPGGKAKQGETEIGNAVREVKEETGLDSIPGYRFDSVSKKSGTDKFTTFFYRVPSRFEVNLSHEHSAYEWVDFDDLTGKELHPKLKKSMPDYLYTIRKKITTFSEWAVITEAASDLGA